MEMKELFRMEKIDKSFPGVHALKSIDLTFYEHEILGLCGENGAGKSTLLKVMTGVYQPDSGEMYYHGEPCSFKNPAESIEQGISIIHQELSFLNDLSVAENIFLGRLPQKHGVINWKTIFRKTKELLDTYGIDIPVNVPMSKLPMAQKQLVEIIKAISRNSKIVIMDEPTSSLGPDDVEKLMNIIRTVSKEGVSFILISHRLEEVMEICTRVVVMRDGAKVKEFTDGKFNKKDIIFNMIGHEMDEQYVREKVEIGDTALELREICTQDLKQVSLNVREGEIVGLYGMAGAGQDEIMEALFGLVPIESGEIVLHGKTISPKCPAEAIKDGIVYITPDRRGDGVIIDQAVDQNIVMASLKKIAKKGIIQYKKQKKISQKWIDYLKIRTPAQSTLVANLSGGNQQKVVLAKWLETMPDILMLNEPMRGVDVGVKKEIFEIIQNLCKQNLAVLIISSDMMEMMDIADRIYTVCDGQITEEFKHGEVTQQQLLLASIDKLEEVK